MKILVDVVPEFASDCPFSITAGKHFPAICKLKLDTSYDFENLIFSHTRSTNCDLEKQKTCEHLAALSDIKLD